MNGIIIIAIVVHVVYFLFWYGINKLRHSKNRVIMEWDNGNVFYESLNKRDREEYWQEDTRILNIFFIILLMFIECTFCLLYINNSFWPIMLITGLLISCLIAIVMNLKLNSKFKKHENRGE